MTTTINTFDLAAQAVRYAQAVAARQQAVRDLREAYLSCKQRHYGVERGSEPYLAMRQATYAVYRAAYWSVGVAKRQELRQRDRLVALARAAGGERASTQGSDLKAGPCLAAEVAS